MGDENNRDAVADVMEIGEEPPRRSQCCGV